MFSSTLKVASSTFDLRYARMVQAMSLSEARSTLGLPPSYTPEELKKAFRQKVMENHPDRGGSPEAMVKVNIAKDVLEGNRPATPEWKSGPSPYRPPPRPRHVDDEVIEGKTFDQAVDGVMSSVDWKVVSAARNDWYLKFLVGQVSEDKWVVLFIKHEPERREFIENPDGSKTTRFFKETWVSDSVRVTAKKKHLLKTVVSIFKQFTMNEHKRRTPSKFLVWPDGVKFSEGSLKRAQARASGVALKDAMAEAKLLDSDSTEVAGRRTQVEIFAERNPEKIKALRDQGRTRYREEEVVDFFISINGGNPVKLADKTIENIKMSYLATWIFNYDFSKRINLTRLRLDPVSKLERIADALTSEPSSLLMGIYKALEEAQKLAKFASQEEVATLLDLVAASSLKTASEALGCSTLEFLGRLYV